MSPTAEFQRRLASIAELIGKLELSSDANVLATTRELVKVVMELHGSGIARMLELARPSGGDLVGEFERDDLVAALLTLHDLHSLGLEARAAAAIGKIGPAVELVGVEGGAVRVKIRASGPTALRLKKTVEEAICAAAPDAIELKIEMAGQTEGFVPLEMLLEPVGGRRG